MNRAARSFVALFTALSVACSGTTCGRSGGISASQSPRGAATGGTQVNQTVDLNQAVQDFGRLLAGAGEGETVSPAQARERLQKLYGLLDTAERRLPRDTFDFSAVVGRVGREPAKLRDWVSSQTAFVPYRGALRDALGTLMDRTGNSLDRSLLLARLIQEAGGQARLARARLSNEQATLLLDRIQHQSAPAAPAFPDATDADIAAYASQSGVTPDVMRTHTEQIERLAAAMKDHVEARVKAQTSAIARAVGLTDETGSADDDRHAAIEALQDHWWVQSQNGGAWMDLDPAAEDSTQTSTAAQETIDAGQLPANLRHEVEIRVVVERWNGSQLSEASPVSAVVRPSDVIGTAVEFRQTPMAWPRDLTGGTPDAPQRFRNAVLAQREWLPTLKVGTRQVARASITETGELNERPGSKPNLMAPPVPTGFFDAFGGGDDPPPPSVLTAEWLEYEIRVPGSPARTIRREIFDLVGPAARAARNAPPELTDDSRLRRGLSLIGETDILLVANHLSGAFIAQQTTSRLRAGRRVFESLATADTAPSAEWLSNVQRLPGPVHELAAARQPSGRSTGAVYIAQPNIFARHIFLTNGLAGSARLAEAIDIVANNVDVRPVANVSRRLARLEHGVLDANLEAVLLGPVASRTSTADAFGTGGQVDRWATVRTPQDLAGLALPPDVRARIEPEVRAGYVVLVARPGAQPTASAGWWRIDPRSGDLLTIGDRGWGQATDEKVLIILGVSLATFAVCGLHAPMVGKNRNWDYAVCGYTGAGGGVAMAAILFVGGPATLAGILLGAVGALIAGAAAGAGQN